MEFPAGGSIAHVRENDGARQTLEEHLFGTASISRKHAEKMGLGTMENCRDYSMT